ncbi:MAG: pyrroloquinoline quinone-dependent dehydrogenase, partial [Bryobacterales bacterium]|nr:pyrroloquinoline quinone-dependent dehydrogenase [Bryobacterales bacterium]
MTNGTTRPPRSRNTKNFSRPTKFSINFARGSGHRYSGEVTLFAVLLLAGAASPTEWRSYGNDPGAMRYSALRQIHTGNVNGLTLAWTFRTGKPGSEAVPLVVNGVMYVTAPDGVYALVPETGQLLWHHGASPAALRGLAYWPGGRGLHPRLFLGNGPALLALDVTTGKPAPGFGAEGHVDLRGGVAEGLPDARYTLDSPPAVFGNIVITGCSNGEGRPSAGAYGDIRGWDARSGRLLWTFHTVPRPGEPGAETWPEGAWKRRSGANVWGFFTVDEARGIVYAPLGSATSDFWGADRPGDNLYGNALVALDARTGALKWHRQLVHHDIWDYDLAAPPALFDIRRNGKTIPAVAQITKMGLLFVFNRVTGEPVYGMEERPVPQSIVPGEITSKTQPFPIKPPPLGKNTFRIEEMYNLSPEHARFCRELFETNQMKIGGPYTPLPLEGNALFFPSTLGGGNWGGVSVDAGLGLLFVNVMHVAQWGHMEKRGEEYIRTSAYGTYARFWDRETRIPCQNPPFGEMIAVDLASGDIAWRKPLGVIDSLEQLGVHNTGTLNLGGSIATAGGLVFIGATNDQRFRAFDSRTGSVLWDARLEAPGHSSPVTYMGRDGRQYVTLMAAGGGAFLGGALSNTLVAYALPNIRRKPLPRAVEKDAAAAAEANKGRPAVGAFAPLTLPPGGAKALTEKTCGTGCHSIEVVTSQRMSPSA